MNYLLSNLLKPQSALLREELERYQKHILKVLKDHGYDPEDVRGLKLLPRAAVSSESDSGGACYEAGFLLGLADKRGNMISLCVYCNDRGYALDPEQEELEKRYGSAFFSPAS